MHIAISKPQPVTGLRPVSLRRLSAFADLGLADEALVRRLKPRTLANGSILSVASNEGTGSWLLLGGWAARVRTMPDGRRQIVHLLLPGDPVNVSGGWAGDRLPIVALTPVIAADADLLRTVLKMGGPEHSALALACARASWCEQVYCLNAIVRLGQQTAYERLAHLFLEIDARLKAVGLVSDGRFQLPVTQDVIAHTLGLSLVHLSRTLRQMRKEGSIAMRPGHVELLKPDVLAAAAGFPHAATWPD